MSETSDVPILPEATEPGAHGIEGNTARHAYWVEHEEGLKASLKILGLDHELPAGTPTSDVLAQQLVLSEARKSELKHTNSSTAATTESLQQKLGDANREIGSYKNITSVLADNTELLEEAKRRDPLTEVQNREGFAHHWQKEIVEGDRAQHRRHGEAMSWSYILHIDLDKFKQLNDSAGHQAGDEVLVKVAGIMSESVREHDVVARMGGDEFAILITKLPDGKRAQEIAEKIRERVASETPVTSSIGLARVDSTKSLAANLEKADKAMYAAKQNGRNGLITH